MRQGLGAIIGIADPKVARVGWQGYQYPLALELVQAAVLGHVSVVAFWLRRLEGELRNRCGATQALSQLLRACRYNGLAGSEPCNCLNQASPR
jgi:hypothetical protein